MPAVMIAASAAQTGSGKTGPEQSAELRDLEQAAEAMHRGTFHRR